jgi:hypothetical protein
VDERQLLLAIAARAQELCRHLSSPYSDEAMEATVRLQSALDNWQSWNVWSNEPDRPHQRGRACRDCQGNIFFAQELINQRWLPLDIDPVDASEVHPEWRYRVDLQVDPPRVWLDLENGGRVYLHHRWTCPTRSGPTKAHGPAYGRRYVVNTARLDKDEKHAIDQLQTLLRKFAEDAERD